VVAAPLRVSALVGLGGRARMGVRATTTMAIATAIEIGQTLWQVESSAGALLLGTTFDIWDLVAYAIGIAIAVAWDVSRDRSRSVADPLPLLDRQP
jgi:hypothetical protein